MRSLKVRNEALYHGHAVEGDVRLQLCALWHRCRMLMGVRSVLTCCLPCRVTPFAQAVHCCTAWTLLLCASF